MILNMTSGGDSEYKADIVSTTVSTRYEARTLNFTNLKGTPAFFVFGCCESYNGAGGSISSGGAFVASGSSKSTYSAGFHGTTNSASMTVNAISIETNKSNTSCSISLAYGNGYYFAPGTYYLCYGYK